MLRRLAPLLGVLLVAGGCGGHAQQSADTTTHQATSQPATTTAIVPRGTSGIVHVETNLGTFAFRLAPAASPRATSSIARLIRKGFFDGLTFHRIVRDFVIQGGDPSGDGTGGPGYLTHDTVAPTTTYPLGTVAMAKTQRAPAGSAGSQFFIVTRRGGVVFDKPVYAVLGHVTKGMAVVLKIGREATDPQTERPLAPVLMLHVWLTKR
jgi:cyclophilin family peptidyl-prolyl cis-trans isomerase